MDVLMATAAWLHSCGAQVITVLVQYMNSSYLMYSSIT